MIYSFSEECVSGSATLIADQCTDLNKHFNTTIRVLQGTNVTLTCSVVDTGVRWNSSQFAKPVRVDNNEPNAMELGSSITFQFDTTSLAPLCTNATATITDIQQSMDGLDLTCLSSSFNVAFSSSVLFEVVGK